MNIIGAFFLPFCTKMYVIKHIRGSISDLSQNQVKNYEVFSC